MRSIAVVVAVASVLLAVAGGAAVTDPRDERVMRVVSNALGPASRSLNWDNGTRPCQDWEGVSCDLSGRVVGISARRAGFNGTLLVAARDLPELQLLDLRDNHLTGPLPDAFFRELKALRLDRNAFTAVPPAFLFTMPLLEKLTMNSNTALQDWTLPGAGTEGRLDQLEIIQANNASVTGTLSAFLRNSSAYPKLTHISLARNCLTGPVPVTFHSRSLSYLDLSQNFLTGTLNFITNFPNLKDVRLDGNAFTGQLPDFRKLPKLKNLSLRQNRLTGLVPMSLIKHQEVVSVTLADNLFQGPLPEFAPWVQSDVADAASRGSRSFCRAEPGPCADDVVLMLSVAAGFQFPESLAASWKGNDPCAGWLGVHCDATGSITGLILCRMELNGTMDPAIGGLRSLKAVVLSGNHIGGVVPATISRLTDILLLDVSDNEINGSIPRLPRGAVIWADQGNRAIGSSSPASLPTAAVFFILAMFSYSLLS